MKRSQINRIVEEEIGIALKEGVVKRPTSPEIEKVLQELPVGKHATIYGKTVFKVAPDQYVYPAKFISRSELARGIEQEVDQMPDDEVFGKG